jgi:hypothetical protein
MKLIKSLLLGSAAGLAAVAGAQAADLPVAKAAAVEYVRVCSAYGAGFFYIPGTETCLRIGGRVRAEFGAFEAYDRSQNLTGFRTRGRVNIDSRTATAYGLLRAYIRYELERNTGPFGTSQGGLDQAFVQFGGLTAGRSISFFDNSDLPTGHFGTLRFSDAPDVNLLAYTFSFGNGFSATISIEDGTDRRNTVSTAVFPGSLILANYAGQRAPDVVGNVKYSGTWGTAQLSAAVHQIRSDVIFATAPAAIAGTIPDTEYGFAVTAQGSVNLPMLAPSDAAWLAATYADGALGYITGGSGQGALTSFAPNAVLGGVGQIVDAVVNPFTGDLSTGRGWSIAGGLRHYWTPQLRSNFFGSYARFEYSASAEAVGISDFDEWRLGANVIFQPVAGLDLGVEVIYARLNGRGAVITPVTIASSNDEDAWEGRLRVQRDF